MSAETDVVGKITTEDGGIDARKLNRGSVENLEGRITERECYQLRVALLHGVSLLDHSEAANYGKSGAHKHATGECHHEDIGARALEHKRKGEQMGSGRWVEQ